MNVRHIRANKAINEMSIGLWACVFDLSLSLGFPFFGHYSVKVSSSKAGKQEILESNR